MSANRDEWSSYDSGTVLVGSPHDHSSPQGLAVKLPTGVWLVSVRGHPESGRTMVRPPSGDIDWVEHYSADIVQEVKELIDLTFQSLAIMVIKARRRAMWN